MRVHKNTPAGAYWEKISASGGVFFMEDILQQGGQITLTALGSLAALFLLT